MANWFPTLESVARAIRSLAVRYTPTLVWLVKPRALLGPLRSTVVQRRALLRLIAVSAEQRVALPPLLEAWSREEWGWQGRRLELLAEALREGLSVSEAVERAPGVLDDADTLLVRFAEQSGAVGPMFRERLAEPLDPRTTVASPLRSSVGYAIVFLVAFLPVVMFTQFAVQPEFEKILHEFSLDPGVSRGVNSLLQSLIAVVAGLLLIVLVLLAVGRVSDGPGRFLRRRVASGLLALVRRRRVGAVLGFLGTTVAQGRPVAGAVATLARYHYDVGIRRRLLEVGNEMSLGVDPWAAFRSARLITPAEAEALAEADEVGARGWTLSALAAARLARAGRVEQRLAAAITPTLVLVFAGFVLLHSRSVFVPLVRLIEGLL